MAEPILFNIKLGARPFCCKSNLTVERELVSFRHSLGCPFAMILLINTAQKTASFPLKGAKLSEVLRLSQV